MRALVISGGGSKGAWAAGLVDHMSNQLKIEWDILIGSSTGSLIVPMVAIGAWDDLKLAYTTTNQSDIFSNCPFSVHKTEDGFKAGFNHWAIIWQFLRGRKTLGESKALQDLIQRTFTQERWEQLLASGKEVIITVSNLTHNVIEYKYARDCSYEDFCDWIWISCNIVPFMSLVQKDNCEYADAGFGNPIPLQEAINLGATEIDVIVLQPRHHVRTTPHSNNALTLLLKTFMFMQRQLARDDISIGLTESRFSDTRIRLIHIPEELTDNSYIFDAGQMSTWWEMGYRHAEKTLHNGQNGGSYRI
jgi:NTE family protein